MEKHTAPLEHGVRYPTVAAVSHAAEPTLPRQLIYYGITKVFTTETYTIQLPIPLSKFITKS